MQCGDASAAKALAHALKGGCAYAGAPAMREAALQIEIAAKAALEWGTPLEATAASKRLVGEAKRLEEGGYKAYEQA